MYSRLTASPPELRKWCGYALILLVPGSFVVLPVARQTNGLAQHSG